MGWMEDDTDNDRYAFTERVAAEFAEVPTTEDIIVCNTNAV